ncbi:DUF4148 domain-containing protein [Paraburkholderia terrae]|uniref:DUF4148 domain-containing protein n=1 Tax=Paraburkholderia terrae TaxID=311230 RepID=UPI001E45F41E|nr:DUF4148 domain-containing protein [Paraburkholderia terrae]
MVVTIANIPTMTFSQQPIETKTQHRTDIVGPEAADNITSRDEDQLQPADIHTDHSRNIDHGASVGAFGSSTSGTSASGSLRPVFPSVGQDKRSLYSKH